MHSRSTKQRRAANRRERIRVLARFYALEVLAGEIWDRLNPEYVACVDRPGFWDEAVAVAEGRRLHHETRPGGSDD